MAALGGPGRRSAGPGEPDTGVSRRSPGYGQDTGRRRKSAVRDTVGIRIPPVSQRAQTRSLAVSEACPGYGQAWRKPRIGMPSADGSIRCPDTLATLPESDFRRSGRGEPPDALTERIRAGIDRLRAKARARMETAAAERREPPAERPPERPDRKTLAAGNGD